MKKSSLKLPQKTFMFRENTPPQRGVFSLNRKSLEGDSGEPFLQKGSPGRQSQQSGKDKPGERVFISLGSNMGERRAHIEEALTELAACEGMAVTAVSSLYATAPVDMPAGTEPFLNCVAELSCAIEPVALLDLLEGVERKLGRADKGKNAPRAIDLDILLFGSRTMASEQLTIPHPRMAARRFVLEPLAEIAPYAMHPVTGMTIAELRDRAGWQDVVNTGERPAVPRGKGRV